MLIKKNTEIDAFFGVESVAAEPRCVLYLLSCYYIGCYIALDQKQDVRGALAKIGLIPSEEENQQQEGDGNGSWMGRMLSGGGSTLALAVLCNKALFPIRTPITLALTPPVARFLRSRKIIKS